MLKYCTPAVWHAAKSVVELLDNAQKRFLRELDLTEKEALLRYNLAPLSCRRDMAALGLIHRAALGKGPAHFRKWFTASTNQVAYDTRYQGGRHTKQLYDYLIAGAHTEVFRRSLFGRVRVYNGLPQRAVDAGTVKLFQRRLQEKLQELATEHQLEPGNTYAFYENLQRPWQETYEVRK